MSGRVATVLESRRAASGLLRAERSSDNQPAGSGLHRGCGRPDRRPAPGAGLCHGRIAGQNSYRTVYSFPGCATALLPTPTMLTSTVAMEEVARSRGRFGMWSRKRLCGDVGPLNPMSASVSASDSARACGAVACVDQPQLDTEPFGESSTASGHTGWPWGTSSGQAEPHHEAF